MTYSSMRAPGLTMQNIGNFGKLAVVALLMLAFVAIPVAQADLYVAFYDDFSTATNWTRESGSGLMTVTSGQATLESDVGEHLAYKASIYPPAYSTTYDTLSIAIVNLTTNLLVFVTGSRSTLVLNVSTAGLHSANVAAASNNDLISSIYLEVVDGSAVVEEISLSRSGMPNFAEQFEFLFNAFASSEVWVLPSILIIATLVVLAILFVPPREKRHVRRYLRGV